MEKKEAELEQVQEPRAFRIQPEDNVATALTVIPAGEFRLLGDEGLNENAHSIDLCARNSGQMGIKKRKYTAVEEIPFGHKVALCDIHEGEMIIKYGIPIGTATSEIQKGQWVHLHCMRSNYDERSSHLNPYTGAPSDIAYE